MPGATGCRSQSVRGETCGELDGYLTFALVTPANPGVDVLGLHDKGRTDMASSSKKKTTMAKLTRESRLRERRLDKQAKKDARKLAPANDPESPGGILDATDSETASTESGLPAPEAVESGAGERPANA